MDTVDDYIKEPLRLKDTPFLMSVESVFVATGRGTVLTGKIECGLIKISDPLELVGGRNTLSTICMGLEMFRRSLDVLK